MNFSNICMGWRLFTWKSRSANASGAGPRDRMTHKIAIAAKMIVGALIIGRPNGIEAEIPLNSPQPAISGYEVWNAAMPQVNRKLPAIHDKVQALQGEAADLGDGFLQYVLGMAILHMEDCTELITELHKEPSLRSPAAMAMLKQVWPMPKRLHRPQEGTMLQPGATCQSCRFWSGKNAPAGECRRMPPVHSSIHHGEVMSAAQPVWPATNADDWCGEWQASTA